MSDKDLTELFEKYKLTPSDMKTVQDYVIETFAGRASPTKNPKLVILGAQSGAGKTELEKLAKLEQDKNIVVCNLDNLRDLHPSADEIKKYHEREYPAITAKFTHPWAVALQKHCRENKLSYMLETTLQNGEGVDGILKRGKEEGYSTELKVLAVNQKLSFLGTELRYESMVEFEGYGRVVGKKEHDIRYNALPNALKFVTERRHYDDLNIYGRILKEEAPGEIKGIRLIAHNPVMPLATYLKERDRQWTRQEMDYFEKRVEKVVSMKEGRGAGKQEIDRFKAEVKSYDDGIQKNKLKL